MDSLLDLLESYDQPDEGKKRLYATIVLPLPLPKMYTYSIPFHLKDQVQVGVRVEVQFGRTKLYSGIIYELHHDQPDYNAKPILNVLDEKPIVTQKQFELWHWMADYYVATMGEVMTASMPGGLKLSSETKISLNPLFETEDFNPYGWGDNRESFLIECLIKKPELTLKQVQELLKQKSVSKTIKSLLEKQIISIAAELQTKYKPKMISYVRLAEPYNSEPERLGEAFQLISSRAHRQSETLLAFIQLDKQKAGEEITRRELCEKAQVDTSLVKKLADKGILDIYKKEVSRLASYDEEGIGNYALAPQQQQALDEIKEHFKTKNTVLLHGVTGSGKTQVFVELIEEMIADGKQVLYLLPEIALTAQIVGRLQKHFGDKIIVYHSKFNEGERVEVWYKALEGTPIILGARSALFLPFKNLGLILVDEEHDPSYKQTDPSPRYNARDTAVYLTHLYGCKTLLGTATPSLETYRNAQLGKYGLVEMKHRFGGLSLPDIVIVDAAEETKRKRMKSHFTPQLLEALKRTLDNGEQAILFQNRRGYAPVYRCDMCGWTTDCENCDISMTYHKYSNDLHCHYCGFQRKMPTKCKACGSPRLKIKGFGTEKIEDELQIYLPDVRVVRMDWDTVKGKSGHNKIIQKVERKEVDILVGTQMVTKGLDFDNIGLVGILSADQMLHFPDFRATERAYQLITQVAGRAGRKKKQGKVYIQAYQVGHPVLWEVKENNFDRFLNRELQERKEFSYPPFCRLIRIQLKHKQQDVVAKAAQLFTDYIKKELGERVLGPAVPGLARVRNLYLMDIAVKLTSNSVLLKSAKQLLSAAHDHLKTTKGFSTVRVLIDVDPY